MAVDSLWDVTKGMPDPKAWFCNNRGDVKQNGNFICWPKNASKNVTKDIIRCCVPGGALAAEECYIARVHMPYVREATFDYKKFRETPVDLNDKLNLRRCERKIGRILQHLGVAYVDRAGLLYTTNDIPVSAWFTNQNGKEGIALNPWVLLQTNMQYLTRLAKKEVVHRALYRNLSELSNKVILNFTLDVLSMRVIAQTPFEKIDKITIRLAEKLFNPKVYKQFPLLALCDCSLTADQVKRNLPSVIANIWCELYETDKRGFLPSLKEIKPSALYFKIKALVDDIFIQSIEMGAGNPLTPTNYPFNVTPSNEINKNSYNDDTVSTQFDKKNESLNNATRDSFKPRKFKNNKGWSNAVTNFWDEQIIQKKDFVEETLKEFAKKWRTEKLLEEMEGKLQQIIGRDEVELKPYPEELTYDGQVLMALGISSPDVIPLYWNEDNSTSNNRKKVAAFFDVSPSMDSLLPYMVRIVESIEETCDCTFMRNLSEEEGGGTGRGAYAFAGSVTDVTEEDLEKMKKGKFKTGASTSFDSVLKHVLEKIKEDNLDIIIIFTDGESGLANKDGIEEFNKSGRKMYRIYMTPFYGDNRDKKAITSDLDQLNGDSFTLCLPPLDRN